MNGREREFVKIVYSDPEKPGRGGVSFTPTDRIERERDYIADQGMVVTSQENTRF